MHCPVGNSVGRPSLTEGRSPTGRVWTSRVWQSWSHQSDVVGPRARPWCRRDRLWSRAGGVCEVGWGGPEGSAAVRHPTSPGVQVQCLVCGGGPVALRPTKFRVYRHGKPWAPRAFASSRRADEAGKAILHASGISGVPSRFDSTYSGFFGRISSWPARWQGRASS